MDTHSQVSQELHQRIAQLEAMAEKLQARTAYLEEKLEGITFQRDSLTKVVPGKFSYLDAQLRYQYVSKEYQEWYQKPSEEIVGKTVEDLMGAEGARNLREHLETALMGKDVHYEFTKLFNDGEERTMIIDYIPHFNSTGEFLGFFVSCQDVTEQKVLKKALECATFQMESLTSILPGKFSYLDTQLRYEFVSKQYEEWYEKPREEILGRTVEELMGTEEYQKLRGYMEEVLSGKEVHYEFTQLFNDGQERTMSIDYIPHISSTGEVLGYLSSCQDITDPELKRLREALRESELRLQLITKAVPEPVS
jgi:PAS domain S-box-containing protein